MNIVLHKAAPEKEKTGAVFSFEESLKKIETSHFIGGVSDVK